MAGSGEPPGVVSHPAVVVRAAEAHLGLASGDLEAEPGFRCRVQADGGDTDVFLARFTNADPPFKTAAAQGGALIDLTQARDLPALELDLLRSAYEAILG